MSYKDKIPKLESSPGHKNGYNPLRARVSPFIQKLRDEMGTKEMVMYKPAKLYDKGKKWFVYYSYRQPDGSFKRYKVYEAINQFKDLEAKRAYGRDAVIGLNKILAKGFSPLDEPEEFEAIVNWSLIQGLNFFKTKIPDMGIRKKTSDSYESLLQILTDHSRKFHHKNLEEITKANCLAILSDMKRERGWSNTTYNNALTFGRLVYSYLINYEICKENPFKNIKKLKETLTQYQPFTDEDYELIKDKAEPELRRFLHFLYNTGTRPNEARQLTYEEHILRDRRMVYVPGKLSKGKRDRYIAVSDSFLDDFQGRGPIFGKSKNHFTNKFTALKRKLKLKDSYTLYSIKHTKCCHMAQDGVNPYNIMTFFGHTSLETTMRYLRSIGVDVSREAADKGR